MTTLHLYFDGGKQRGSYMIFKDVIDPAHLLYHHKFDMDGIADSNQGEFTMLLRALRRIHIHQEDTSDVFLVIYGDNTLVPRTVGKKQDGKWVNVVHTEEVFNYLAGRIQERLDRFKGFRYNTVKRKEIVAKLGH